MTPPLTTFEDSALIKLALKGQEDCFTILMDRHLGTLRRRIGSMVKNPSDTDDLLQEVSLKVWRHLSTFRSESSFRTWITRVAINEVLQSYRRQRRSPVFQPLTDLEAAASAGESPHQSLARADVTRTVRNAVVGLPRKYSQVLILRDLEEVSTREAAQRLQSSIPAVKTRLLRGRLKLLAALQRSRIRELSSVVA